MTYRSIEGPLDIRAWPMPGRNHRWCATISDSASKVILATGAGMSRDAAIADARGKLLRPAQEIVRDMPQWRYWVALGVAIIVIGWCAYIALHRVAG